MAIKIIVVGSVNLDILTRINTLPEIGETVFCENLEIAVGGKGFNQAYYCSIFGQKVIFSCVIGTDYFAELLVKEIENQKNIEPLFQISKKNSGSAVVLNYKNDNSIIVNKGSNWEWKFEKFNQDIINDGDYILFQLETPFVESLKLITEIKSKRKVTVFLNPSPALKNESINLNGIDFLILNESEAENITNKDPNIEINDCVNQILKKGINDLIITLGSKGCVYANKEGIKKFSTRKINVKSTVGAGDSFLGAFIHKYSLTKEIETSINFAQNVASKVCESEKIRLSLEELK